MNLDPTGLPLVNTYVDLPEILYARLPPTPVRAPRLLYVNESLAEALGIAPHLLAKPEGIAILAGNRVPEGATPLAMAYAGHQFGSFVPSLGDGRAVLLGEIVGRDGIRRDLHLKGAGRTPFSRGGDGRAGLGPVLRETLVSEAMAGLGIPTTRALAMVTTGETLHRDQGPMPGAILARVARSHVRVGTFEYCAYRRDREALTALAHYVIARLHPQEATPGASETRADSDAIRTLLEDVIRAQADLIAQWMLVGFIHGVMNTDNVSIAGETIDYGPCAFLDAYHPAMVLSSIDHAGRYAYDQQPRIGHWNLCRFAEALLPLLSDRQETAIEIAQESLAAYPGRYETQYRTGLRRKVGLAGTPAPGQGSTIDIERDDALTHALLDQMAEHAADFTLTFRGLTEQLPDSGGESQRPGSAAAPTEPFFETTAFRAWQQSWHERLASEGRDTASVREILRTTNPAYIPRNHRVQEVIDAATSHDDLKPFHDLLAVVTRPYEDHPDRVAYQRPPEPHEAVRQTFCGT